MAYAPPGTARYDRCNTDTTMVIGRGLECSLTIRDDTMSRHHCKIRRQRNGYTIEDLDSKNGTFVDGRRITEQIYLHHQAVIRLGRSILVFHAAPIDLSAETQSDTFGLVGRFHASDVINQLTQCNGSDCHILLAGPTCSVKNLVSRAFAKMLGIPLLAHSATEFASEQEATAAIFGVEQRPWFIEQAARGVLLLDHASLLPNRVQKRLAELMRTATFSRVGEKTTRTASAILALASNQLPLTFVFKHGFLGLLRILSLPALKYIKADIPDIFDHLLLRELEGIGYTGEPLPQLLSVYHYEQLMLDDFDQQNVDGLVDLAGRIASQIDDGNEPAIATDSVFAKHFGTQHATLQYPPVAPCAVRDTSDGWGNKAR